MKVSLSAQLFCFGLGFCATALIRHLREQGQARGQRWHITGTARKPTPALIESWAAHGVVLRSFHDDAPLFDPGIPGPRLILSSAPPCEGFDPLEECDPVLAHHRHRILQAHPHWVGYLSTTAVYGDHGGAWVDETSAPAPTQARARARLQAEQNWQALPLPVQLFRLSGLYGPGRNALKTARAGKSHRIHCPGHSANGANDMNHATCTHVTNRIHIADVAAVLAASMQQPAPGMVYNLADDEPACPQSVVRYACHLAGVPLPPVQTLEEAALSPLARSFYADNKRVRNDRIKQVLGVTLAYPNYRSGLDALLAAGE